MDDEEEIAKRAREIVNSNQQAFEATVQKRMLDLSISRNLAEYLVGLELRIDDFERRDR